MRAPILFSLSAKALSFATCLFVTGVNAAATAHISVNSPGVIEGNSPDTATLNFTLTRSGEINSAVTLQYRTDDNTAIAPDDYTAIPPMTATLDAGQTSATIPVTVNGDALVEGNESLFLHLTGFVSVQGPPANYAAASDFAVDTQPLSVTVADVNGDGLTDLSVAKPGSETVTVLLNTTAPGATAPSYAATSDFTVATHPLSAIAADIDGDGLLDLALSNQASDTLAVLLKTTAASPTYAATGNFVLDSAATPVDGNGDGLQDLAVASPGSGNVSVLLNQAAVFDNSEGTGIVENDDAELDTTPDPFNFADQAGVERSTQTTSAAVTITGINGAALISVSEGSYSIGCSATFTTTSGTITNGQSVCVRHTSAASDNTAVNTVLTIGGVSDTFTSTTQAEAAQDLQPDPFTFTAVTGASRDKTQISNPVTISGINGASPISVSGPDARYSIGCTSQFRSSSSTITNGQSVCVRHTSAGEYGTSVSTELTIGGVSSTFTSTTRTPSTTPDAFEFSDRTGVEPEITVTSNSVTISGIESNAEISVTGGSYAIGCSGTFTSSPGTISDGQRVCVRHTSSASFNTATDTVLTVGGVFDTFTSTTLASDGNPIIFTFIDLNNVLLNSPQTSNTITVGQAGAISVTGGEYSVGCASTFTSAPGSISRNETVCVRHTSSAFANTATHTTLTVGGVSDTFTSTTPAPLSPDHVGLLGLWDGLLGLLAALGFGRRQRASVS